ncbi:hypothetical protein BKA80DRAFT_256760 [Phyllosticta citrichinensis]
MSNSWASNARNQPDPQPTSTSSLHACVGGLLISTCPACAGHPQGQIDQHKPTCSGARTVIPEYLRQQQKEYPRASIMQLLCSYFEITLSQPPCRAAVPVTRTSMFPNNLRGHGSMPPCHAGGPLAQAPVPASHLLVSMAQAANSNGAGVLETYR